MELEKEEIEGDEKGEGYGKKAGKQKSEKELEGVEGRDGKERESS